MIEETIDIKEKIETREEMTDIEIDRRDKIEDQEDMVIKSVSIVLRDMVMTEMREEFTNKVKF